MIVAAATALLVGSLAGLLAGLWRGRREVAALHAQLEAQGQELATQRERVLARDERLETLGTDLEAERQRQRALQAELTTARERLADSEARRAESDDRHRAELRLLDEAKSKLTDAFAALAHDALHQNNEQFLDLAKTSLERFQAGAQEDLAGRQTAIEGMVKPLVESLGKFDSTVRELEKQQGRAEGSLNQQLQQLAQLQGQLQVETQTLARALKSSSVRGRWGEVQLRRVVELAGMLEHCDFDEQPSETGEAGPKRPDMIVHLPGEKTVVVDAKAPLAAFLEALEAPTDGARAAKLKEHGQQVRRHIRQLASKEYYKGLDASPEFVVMFLPGEAFFAAALEADPSLIEEGPETGVMLATPTTLIALLKAIAYGWRQEQIAENAKKISEVGRSLHERLGVFAQHFASLKRGLENAVGAYNGAVASLETRLLVSATQLAELGADSGKEVAELGTIDAPLRAPALPAPRGMSHAEAANSPSLPGLASERGATS